MTTEHSILLVRNVTNACNIVSWLIEKDWQFEIDIAGHNPFKLYHLHIPDDYHRFMTAMTWGLNDCE